jgi:murein DD-endopeptidase MepM/ murein hydrolase activator NlpD
MSNERIGAALARSSLTPGSALAFAILVGGCSADVTRFDFPMFGLTDKGSETGSLPPTPSESVARRNPSFDDGSAGPPRGAGLGDTNRGYAGPPSNYASPAPYSAPQGYSAPQPYTTGSGPGERVANARDYVPPAPSADPAPGADRYAGRTMDRARAAARGETIQVQQGDTLYGIARRYGVSVAALIEINGLAHGSTIKPGQQLVLPAGVPATVAAEPPAGRAPLARSAPPPPVASAAPPVAPAGWEGRHTLKPGESIYGVARQHGVTLAELQRVNGITEPTRVRAGTVLSVPGKAEAAAPVAETASVPQAPAPRSPQAAPVQPRMLNAPGGERTAALGDRSTDATTAPAPAAEAASGRFRWPARGRVIASFGKRTDGTHNDGINIAVPQGTDIHAAEGGRVAYAGNELKGYGNLVLIRHDNGWVSAYAHADQIMVKRDDVVKRGQVIAKAGKTGTVDQPQLHFELRQGAKPVDPLPHMEK